MEKYVIGNDNIMEIERLRSKIYNSSTLNEYFIMNLQNGKMLAIEIILDDILIGGCYISRSHESLYIENLFIDEPYRGKGYAEKLLEYVLSNKAIFEEYFNIKFLYSKLEPNSNDMVNFYMKMGYSKPNDYNIMKRRV